jgi:anion-transporting  ArsA/GET3 family ATPase
MSLITKIGKARNIDEALEEENDIQLLKTLHEYLCPYIDSEKLNKNARNILKNPEKIIEKIKNLSKEINETRNTISNNSKYNFLKKCTPTTDTITLSAINQLGLAKFITNIYKVILLNDYYKNNFEELKNKKGCYEQYNPLNKTTFDYYYNVVFRYPIIKNLLKIGTKILVNIYNMYYGRSDFENNGEVYDEDDILQLFRSTSLAGLVAFIVFLVLAIVKGIFGSSAAGYKYKK